MTQRIITEDGVSVAVGDRVYDYYDMEPGVIEEITNLRDGVWFRFRSDQGRTHILNGPRICSMAYARRRGFRDAGESQMIV